ncbi:MAG: GNAT family N-acetyltransferase [Treponema sp.]|nr:GNAT family N-acetyltransferase [Treponema sp.]
MEFTVACREDFPQILELYKQLNPTNDNFPADKINKVLDKIQNSDIRYFIAKDGSTITGCLYIAIIPNLTFNGRSIGYIENVITHEQYRRKGIGEKLMEMAVEYAKSSGCYKAVLQSGIKRKEAHLFYQALGFSGDTKKAYELRF